MFKTDFQVLVSAFVFQGERRSGFFLWGGGGMKGGGDESFKENLLIGERTVIETKKTFSENSEKQGFPSPPFHASQLTRGEFNRTFLENS